MGFDAPVYLIAAPVVAVLVAVLAWAARRARVRHARHWSEQLGRTARQHGRVVWLGLGLAAGLTTVALAGPRWGHQVVETTSPALDMVIAVDVSRSMLAEDVEPSRLGRAQAQTRRLLHDLAGDRIGLVAFAGRSFILSPLTADMSALNLLVDALSPDMISAGGTDLAAALRQGRELLLASDRVADRVLVLVTDGEHQDSLRTAVEEAARVKRDGIRLVLVAEGDRAPARIPERSPDGRLLGYHEDVDGNVVETVRRDDILTAVADAGEGVLVAAPLEDQAGAVRDLVVGLKRAPTHATATRNDVPRGWIAALTGAVVLLVLAMTRRTAALAALLLAGTVSSARAQAPRNAGDEAWRAGRVREAAVAYLAQARRGAAGDTAWLNAGTALLALHRDEQARDLLQRAAGSLEPEIRFRALYNLGLLALQLAESDSASRETHLADARARYREALLLKPTHLGAKWNLELAIAETPPQGGGPAPQGPSAPLTGGDGGSATAPQSLTRAQAEQLLASIAAEERQTRQELSRRAGEVREPRRGKDW
jgi:Ca-activated chloride channel family protein